MRKENKPKISFCYPRDLRAFPRTYSQRGGVTLCLCVYEWFSPWWLIFVLSDVYATLGDAYGIWEHLHSFRGKWNVSRVIPRLYAWVWNLKALLISGWTYSSGYDCGFPTKDWILWVNMGKFFVSDIIQYEISFFLLNYTLTSPYFFGFRKNVPRKNAWIFFFESFFLSLVFIFMIILIKDLFSFN